MIDSRNVKRVKLGQLEFGWDVYKRQVMDSTAAAMCKDNNIPILVFNLHDPTNIYRAAIDVYKRQIYFR